MKIKMDHSNTNPKDAVGSRKLSLSLVPDIAIAHEAAALTVGAARYGKNNWRAHPVQAMIYVDAALRHLSLWKNGEEYSEEGVHHLGHARACLAILLDAMEIGNLIDDRDVTEHTEDVYAALLNDLNTWVWDRTEVRFELTDKGKTVIEEYIDEVSEDHTGGGYSEGG